MKLSLGLRGETGALALLVAAIPPTTTPLRIGYRTRTGALARLDGIAIGAFDREHDAIVVPPADRERELLLEVERRSLPTNGLPSTPGVRWQLLNAMAHETPARQAECTPVSAESAPVPAPSDPLPLVGHSHLDVAWLWTYDEARRKALRTFAIAADLLARDDAFVFAQSQPQLYAFVEGEDAELFARVCVLARERRFDPDLAALWVEPDCNLPSGESLLRQMLFAHRYCAERFECEPGIAWLPDSFGFANTLPMLLAHAGIRYFGTTKLQWNDTTRFPYAQFVWRAPDGSEVVAAQIVSMEGGIDDGRIRSARERREPIVTGYGDGGGGVTAQTIDRARGVGRWIRPRAWFESLEARRDDLPVHDDELYLEYHRGVYTTQRKIKRQNALLERALAHAEELAAWCAAVRAPAALRADLRGRLRAAWEIVLRNQFHDVLPGTSIAAVHDDAVRELAEAGQIVASAIASAEQALPRTRGHERLLERCEPCEDDDGVLFDNGLVQARTRRTGALIELSVPGGRNLCTQGNVLALYRDRPRKWEAWNIDAGYERKMRHAVPGAGEIADAALVVPFRIGRSSAEMRLSMYAGEPFLRVDLRVDWRERRQLLRVENWFALDAERAVYGTPHGVVARSTKRETPQERAKFEVPGQRFASVRDAQGAGVALFSLDAYGWSARALPKGGVQLGHSLLRAPLWPDPRGERGEHELSYAFAPFESAGTGALERAWERFAHEPRVRLFTSPDDAVLIAGCKPAEDGDGVIVRVRECDGAARVVALRCGGRMREAVCVDGLEREIAGTVRIQEEHLHFTLPASGLRAFRVRFA